MIRSTMIRSLLPNLMLAALAPLSASAALMVEHAPLSATEELALEHPVQFQFEIVKEEEDHLRPALRLQKLAPDGTVSVAFKIFAGRLTAGGPQNQADLDAAVKKMGIAYSMTSVEKTNEVHDLTLPQPGSLGAYAVFTDATMLGVAKPPPDEFRTITVGLVRIGDYLFTIEGGANDKNSEDFHEIVKTLAGLKVEALSAGAASPSQKP